MATPAAKQIPAKPGSCYRRVMGALAALTRATAEFERRLAAVPPGRWQDPTPCEAWDRSRRSAQDQDRKPIAASDVICDDRRRRHGASSIRILQRYYPLTAFQVSAAAQIDAFSRPGAMAELCHHPAGQIPGQQFSGLRRAIWLSTPWDIARAVGADEHLDEELVRESFAVYEPMMHGFAESEAFGSGPRLAADDVSPQSRLLRHLGTAGQLCHHLRERQAGGLVVPGRRSGYAVPAGRVITCLVLVAAAHKCANVRGFAS